MKRKTLFAFSAAGCMLLCAVQPIAAFAVPTDDFSDFPMNSDWGKWDDLSESEQPPKDSPYSGQLYYYCGIDEELPQDISAYFRSKGQYVSDNLSCQFTGVITYRSDHTDFFENDAAYMEQWSEMSQLYYVKAADGTMTEEEAKTLIASIPARVEAAKDAASDEAAPYIWADSFSLVYKVVPPAQPDVMSYCEESGAVWITPPDGLPDYVQFALKEFPMSFNYMPGEPNNFIYYEHSIEQPEDCKTEFTGVIHVTGVYDIFAGVFYDMPDYLSTASECEWGTYAKRKDNPMTAEEAKALGEQLLQEGKIKSYQLVWRRIAETKDADINSDGSVAADDAQMVLREYVNVLAVKAPSFSKQQRLLADVTNDNLIDAKDALQILKYYVDTLAEK